MSPDTRSSDQPPVLLDGVSIFYGEVIGLSKVDLRLEPGITGIIGPNGSGKTTLMRALTGLIAPDEGVVQILGDSPFQSAEIRRRIGLVPSTECYYEGLSGRRNLEVAFLSHGYDRGEARNRAAEGLELVGLTADGDRRYGTWSRGMRQRLKLALTLASECDVVLLDEPFLGVDPPSRKFLRGIIQQLGESGHTVLASSHVLHEIESLTDLVGVLAHGRLLGFGRIETLLRELRDRHPHRVRLDADDPRRLAIALMERPHVREVGVVGDRSVEFVTEHPEDAYRELAQIVASTGVLIRRVETLDNSLEAVFRHVTEAGSRRL